jgi:Ni/Co efflux regulator RcnB
MKSKFLITALIAATLAPVAAQAQTRELQRDRNDIRRDEREDLREARQEYREDRRDHRASRHSANRHPRFHAPFRYHRYNNGARMNVGYYSPRYYLSDHRYMRLPAPGYNMRYVRHYDDLLLVNVRTGHVVRVYRNIYR